MGQQPTVVNSSDSTSKSERPRCNESRLGSRIFLATSILAAGVTAVSILNFGFSEEISSVNYGYLALAGSGVTVGSFVLHRRLSHSATTCRDKITSFECRTVQNRLQNHTDRNAYLEDLKTAPKHCLKKPHWLKLAPPGPQWPKED